MLQMGKLDLQGPRELPQATFLGRSGAGILTPVSLALEARPLIPPLIYLYSFSLFLLNVSAQENTVFQGWTPLSWVQRD